MGYVLSFVAGIFVTGMLMIGVDKYNRWINRKAFEQFKLEEMGGNMESCEDCVEIYDGGKVVGGFRCPKHHEQIKVTEYHEAMETGIGGNRSIIFFLNEEEKGNVISVSEFIKFLQKKIERYGDRLCKELTYKDGKCVIQITGEFE